MKRIVLDKDLNEIIERNIKIAWEECEKDAREKSDKETKDTSSKQTTKS